MRFTLDQLRTFVLVADTGSFSAAARQSRKAQSAVSTAISNLEIDLDVTLFRRTGRTPELTEAGRNLLVEAQAVLMRCSSLQEHAYAFAQHTETEVVVAIDNAVPLATVSAALDEWQSAYPTVSLRITHPSMPNVARHLRDAKVDLGLMLVQPEYPKEIAFRRVGQLRMVEVAHAQHPLAQAQAVTFTDLSDHRQLIFAPHGHALATSEYVISPRHYTTESYFALLDMLRAGLGWAMVPYRLVAEELRRGVLREIDLAAYPFTPWLIGADLLWCRSRQLGRAGNALRKALAATRITDAKPTQGS